MNYWLTFSNAAGFMPDDVLLNKVATVERCLGRVNEEYAGHEREFARDQTRQDAIILNLQRACEASIDLAMHWIRRHRLGLPQDSRQAFAMLEEASLIDTATSEAMQAMVGFRNVAVHDYQTLNLDIVRAIIENRLEDFTKFTKTAIRDSNPPIMD